MSNFRYVRPDNFPPAVKNLIIINVVVWIAQMIFKDEFTRYIALFPLGDPEFKAYQVVTHMFAHSTDTFFHIIFNMLVLWMFGRVLEQVWGSKRFLIFYMLSGIGAGIVHLAIQYLQGGEAVAVGASGAIMGVMVAFAVLFPNTELYIMFLPIPIKAKWAVLGYVVLDLLGGFSNIPGDNIAHFAHLGGALTGFIIVLIWNKTNRKTLY